MKSGGAREEDGGSDLGVALFCFTRSEVFLFLSVLGCRLLFGVPGLLLLRIPFLFRELIPALQWLSSEPSVAAVVASCHYIAPSEEGLDSLR